MNHVFFPRLGVMGGLGGIFPLVHILLIASLIFAKVLYLWFMLCFFFYLRIFCHGPSPLFAKTLQAAALEQHFLVANRSLFCHRRVLKNQARIWVQISGKQTTANNGQAMSKQCQTMSNHVKTMSNNVKQWPTMSMGIQTTQLMMMMIVMVMMWVVDPWARRWQHEYKSQRTLPL